MTADRLNEAKGEYGTMLFGVGRGSGRGGIGGPHGGPGGFGGSRRGSGGFKGSRHGGFFPHRGYRPPPPPPRRPRPMGCGCLSGCCMPLVLAAICAVAMIPLFL